MNPSVKRWRRSHETGWAEFLLEEGKWVNPDCCYHCLFCGQCLGCMKQTYLDGEHVLAALFDGESPAGDPLFCPHSDDGHHHATDIDPETN